MTEETNEGRLQREIEVLKIKLSRANAVVIAQREEINQLQQTVEKLRAGGVEDENHTATMKAIKNRRLVSEYIYKEVRKFEELTRGTGNVPVVPVEKASKRHDRGRSGQYDKIFLGAIGAAGSLPNRSRASVETREAVDHRSYDVRTEVAQHGDEGLPPHHGGYAAVVDAPTAPADAYEDDHDQPQPPIQSIREAEREEDEEPLSPALAVQVLDIAEQVRAVEQRAAQSVLQAADQPAAASETVAEHTVPQVAAVAAVSSKPISPRVSPRVSEPRPEVPHRAAPFAPGPELPQRAPPARPAAASPDHDHDTAPSDTSAEAQGSAAAPVAVPAPAVAHDVKQTEAAPVDSPAVSVAAAEPAAEPEAAPTTAVAEPDTTSAQPAPFKITVESSPSASARSSIIAPAGTTLAAASGPASRRTSQITTAATDAAVAAPAAAAAAAAPEAGEPEETTNKDEVHELRSLPSLSSFLPAIDVTKLNPNVKSQLSRRLSQQAYDEHINAYKSAVELESDSDDEDGGGVRPNAVTISESPGDRQRLVSETERRPSASPPSAAEPAAAAPAPQQRASTVEASPDTRPAAPSSVLAQDVHEQKGTLNLDQLQSPQRSSLSAQDGNRSRTESATMSPEEKALMDIATELKNAQDRLPVLDDTLYKKSPSGLQLWQKRFVAVYDYNIYYSQEPVRPEDVEENANNTGRPPVHCIPLVVVNSIAPVPQNKLKFVVEARDPKYGKLRRYKFRAQDEKQRNAWIKGLGEHRNHLLSMLRWVTLNKNSAVQVSWN